MSMNCNPIHYLKHAWSNTNSIWGKICIVLFYVFIWLQIIGAVWSMFDITGGGAWDCMWDSVSAKDQAMIMSTMKVMNFWILGFMLYADRGGIKVWNVLMVAVWYLIQWLMYKPIITAFLEDPCPDELQQMNTAMIVSIVWIFLAVLFSFVDNRKADSGTSEENQALV